MIDVDCHSVHAEVSVWFLFLNPEICVI